MFPLGLRDKAVSQCIQNQTSRSESELPNGRQYCLKHRVAAGGQPRCATSTSLLVSCYCHRWVCLIAKLFRSPFSSHIASSCVLFSERAHICPKQKQTLPAVQPRRSCSQLVSERVSECLCVCVRACVFSSTTLHIPGKHERTATALTKRNSGNRPMSYVAKEDERAQLASCKHTAFVSKRFALRRSARSCQTGQVLGHRVQPSPVLLFSDADQAPRDNRLVADLAKRVAMVVVETCTTKDLT